MSQVTVIHGEDTHPAPRQELTQFGVLPSEVWSITTYCAFQSLERLYEWFYTVDVIIKLIDRGYTIRQYSGTVFHLERQSLIDATRPIERIKEVSWEPPSAYHYQS